MQARTPRLTAPAPEGDATPRLAAQGRYVACAMQPLLGNREGRAHPCSRQAASSLRRSDPAQTRPQHGRDVTEDRPD
jgi:hypothetical protein